MTTSYWHDKAVNPPKPREVLVLGFTYPGLPPRELSPNARVGHFERSRAAASFKNEVIALIKEQISGKRGEIYRLKDTIVSITWGLPDKRKRDWDNLIAASKYLVDALVTDRVISDDSVRDYTPRYAWFDSPKKPLTEIKVYRVKYDN